MALTVETGSASATADSYISVGDADTYFSNLGLTAWTGTTEVKEAALRRGTQYIDLQYAAVFKGRAYDDDQALEWPRTGVTDGNGYGIAHDEIPVSIGHAAAEAALRSLTTTELHEDIANPGSVQSEAIRVGPISVATQWAGSGQTPLYQKIDLLLREYIDGSMLAERG